MSGVSAITAPANRDGGVHSTAADYPAAIEMLQGFGQRVYQSLAD